MKIIGAHHAHQNGIYGQGVKIAVIDEGWFDCNGDTKERFTQSTKDRLAHLTPLEGEEKGSAFGHSNLVASIIAGKDGIAPQAELEVFSLPANFGDEYYANAIEEAIAAKVDFINMSLGWGVEFPQILKDALYKARDANIGVLIAASNDSYGISDSTLGKHIYPGIGDFLKEMKGYAWFVGATEYDQRDEQITETRASFSNLFDTTVAQYSFVVPGKRIRSYGAYAKEEGWQGTSTSTPIAIACAALLKSQNPEKTPAQIFVMSAQSARKNPLFIQETKEEYMTCFITHLQRKFNTRNGQRTQRTDMYLGQGSPNTEKFNQFVEDEYHKHIKLNPCYYGQGVIDVKNAFSSLY